MKINEIYRSIQGESSYAGFPCVFVRLTYCNLRCSYCDTEYAFYDGKDYTVEQVLAEIMGYDCQLVEITGGEPLLQKDVYPLMDNLIDAGYKVLLETGGSIDIGQVNRNVVKIMDLKCPSSGECDRNLYTNIENLSSGDEIKFVIGNYGDYLWTREMLTKYRLPERFTVLLSTVFGQIQPRQVVEWMLKDDLKVRFQLQMHKYVWDANTRGV